MSPSFQPAYFNKVESALARAVSIRTRRISSMSLLLLGLSIPLENLQRSKKINPMQLPQQHLIEKFQIAKNLGMRKAYPDHKNIVKYCCGT